VGVKVFDYLIRVLSWGGIGGCYLREVGEVLSFILYMLLITDLCNNK